MKKKGETKVATECRTHRERKRTVNRKKGTEKQRKGQIYTKRPRRGRGGGGGAGKPQSKPARGWRTERERKRRKGHEAGQRRRERQKGRAG